MPCHFAALLRYFAGMLFSTALLHMYKTFRFIPCSAIEIPQTLRQRRVWMVDHISLRVAICTSSPRNVQPNLHVRHSANKHTTQAQFMVNVFLTDAGA
jgi:hypothetical protein